MRCSSGRKEGWLTTPQIAAISNTAADDGNVHKPTQSGRSDVECIGEHALLLDSYNLALEKSSLFPVRANLPIRATVHRMHLRLPTHGLAGQPSLSHHWSVTGQQRGNVLSQGAFPFCCRLVLAAYTSLARSSFAPPSTALLDSGEPA